MHRSDHALATSLFNARRKRHIHTSAIIASSLEVPALDPVIHRIPRDPESRSDIGDREFFALLRAWTAAHRHGTATTADFEDLASETASRPLGEFFEAWLFRPELPDLPPPPPAMPVPTPVADVTRAEAGRRRRR